MDPSRFEHLLVGPESTLREVVQAIDAGAVEIALVVDSERRLLGTISDGDVRRALLAGVSLDDGIAGVLHADPVTAPATADPGYVLGLLTDHAIEQVPLLDEEQRVVDVAFIHDLVRSTMEQTPVVLMAGGEGRRLRPLTEELPKPMLPVGEEARPLLETTLRQIADTGFRRILLAVNYRSADIESHFGDGADLGLNIGYLREEQPLGSGGALTLARSELDHPFVVLNADLLTNVNLGALIRFHAREGNAVTVGVRRYALEVPYGVVDVDGTRVTGLEEKPTVGFFINAGIYAVDPGAVRLMPEGVTEFNMTDLIETTLAAGQRVGAFPVREYWLDIGQLSDYERAHQDHATHFSVGG